MRFYKFVLITAVNIVCSAPGICISGCIRTGIAGGTVIVSC